MSHFHDHCPSCKELQKIIDLREERISDLERDLKTLLDATSASGIPDHQAWVERVLSTRYNILNPEPPSYLI